MRKRCLKTIYEIAKKNKDVVFIGSDLGVNTMNEFKEEMPERFFMEGISEQHIVGMAAGLAMSGKQVYFNTIATFITRRCTEQNIIDLGITNSNVRLIGNGGGLVYAPLGPTHLAYDDIALMRAIPNMTIIAPADADEMERAVLKSIDHKGPIYFRVAKGGDPIISKEEHGLEIGKAITHKEGEDALIITFGIMVNRALKVACELEKEGLKVGVINTHTLKPFDSDTILKAISKSKVVITLEEHTEIGGLGSIVSKLMAENAIAKPFKVMALPDVFPEKYGSQNELINFYKLEVEHIIESIKNLTAKIRNIL